MQLTGAEDTNNWIKQASHDFAMAQVIINEGGYDTCAFLCQQAVEKYLKALFIRKYGKNPPKTHYLDELAKHLNCPQETLDICKELAADYMTARYPDAGIMAPCDEYSEEDATSKLQKAQTVISWVEGALNQ
jgi:HEPN domain-containing protein